jgi:glycosyltransferase involved in cell wall biosynthesis
MKKINISIVTPTHNSSSFIEKLLQSIPSRDDLELFLIDDHSTDFSQLQDVVARYQDSFTINLIHNTGKSSAGAARNLGLKAAKGKWVLFADSDDYFSDSFDSILNDYLIASHDIILFPPKAVIKDSTEQSDRADYFNTLFSLYKNGSLSIEELSCRLTPVWSKIYRRESIANVKFNEVPVANDVAWTAKAAFSTINNIAVDTRSIYVVQERSGSITRTKRFHWKRVSIRVLERVKADLYLKSRLLMSPYRHVKLGRARSIFRNILHK